MGAGRGLGLFAATMGSIIFPGMNPTIPPSDGFEWRGNGGIGSSEGSWYNPQTSEVWRADLLHPGSIGAHWDYRDSNGVWWRVYPDGTIKQKK